MAAAMVTALVLAACQPGTPTTPPNRHDGFQGGPGNQGIVQTGLAPDARVRWTREIGSGHVRPPIIVDDLVIAPVNIPDPTGGGHLDYAENRVIAFDRRNGAIRWELPTWDGLARVASGGNRLAVVSPDRIMSVELSTGRPLWTRRAPGRTLAAPLVVDGVAYVGSRNPADRSDHGRLTAYDMDRGELWSVPTNGVDGSESSPAVAGDTVYVAGKCNGVQAFARSDGALRWFHRPWCSGGGTSGSVVVRDGRVYVHDGEVVGAWKEGAVIDAASGRRLGSFDSAVTPAVGVRNMITGGGETVVNRSPDGTVTRWTHRFHQRYLIRHPVVAGQQVLVVDMGPDQPVPEDAHAYLTELELATGREVRRINLGRWSHATEGGSQRWLAVANGTAATHLHNRLVVVY